VSLKFAKISFRPSSVTRLFSVVLYCRRTIFTYLNSPRCCCAAAGVDGARAAVSRDQPVKAPSRHRPPPPPPLGVASSRRPAGDVTGDVIVHKVPVEHQPKAPTTERSESRQRTAATSEDDRPASRGGNEQRGSGRFVGLGLQVPAVDQADSCRLSSAR